MKRENLQVAKCIGIFVLLPLAIATLFTVTFVLFSAWGQSEQLFYMRHEMTVFLALLIVPTTIAFIALKNADKATRARILVLFATVGIALLLTSSTMLSTQRTESLIETAKSMNLPSEFIEVAPIYYDSENSSNLDISPGLLPCVSFDELLIEGCGVLYTSWEWQSETNPTDEELRSIVASAGFENITSEACGEGLADSFCSIVGEKDGVAAYFDFSRITPDSGWVLDVQLYNS